jgi:hypothetical protein
MKRQSIIKLGALLLVCCVMLGCTPEEEKLGTIYGTVTDFSSGEPIANANVHLNPRGETTLTGSDGTFQFNDLPTGSYSLSLSKNGYVDLDDDYVINIDKGNSVQRSIQMQKQSSSLQIVDNNGNIIALLDFGADEDVSQKAFNIFNNGNLTLDFTISKTANWIDEVIPSSGTVAIGDTKPITVIINRASLGSGENKSTLLITTPTAGSVEIVVKATVPFMATVETGEVEEVTNNSAKCNGDVTDNGGVTVIEKGICYSEMGNPTVNDQRVSGGPGIGAFTCTLTGLEEKTDYYVRAYAINSVDTAYGVPKSFTTKGKPTVSTVGYSNVSTNSASCSGNVLSDGGASVSERGICYGLAPNPSINNSKVTSGSGTGSFTCNLTNLTNNTTYYIKAYAKNAYGIAYGEEKHFTTDDGKPTVFTVGYSNVSANKATCSGNVSSAGGSSVTERGICYSLAPNPTINNSIVKSGTGTGSFTCNLTNLTNQTTYYIKAYAKNSYGVAYGEEKHFTTEILPTFQYGGYTYYVAPDPGNYMSWGNANSYCNGLTIYGLSGWRLPTKDELLQMYAERNQIGGFNSSYYWSSTFYYNTYYYIVNFYNGSVLYDNDDNRCRPIRRKN